MGVFRPGLCKTRRLSAVETGGAAVEAIDLAGRILRGGGTVAFPTETVYGLGANALDAHAVGRVFLAKQRPRWDPLIVHVSDRAMLDQVATIPPEFRPRLQHLIAAFWPGPLTLLLPRKPAIPDAVTAGRPLVGVRMPDHRVAMELIRMAGVPIAAPSANRFGHTSPTTAAHVLEDLDGSIDAVLDGGSTLVGIESTVLDAARTPMVIYRPGSVTTAMLRRACACEVEVFQPGARPADDNAASLPSPGVGLRHYAPRARMELVAISSQFDPGALRAAVARNKAATELVGVMLPVEWDAGGADEAFAWGRWGDDDGLAQRLFAGLRWLDGRNVDVIVCPVPGGEGVAAALRDRLEKAARK